MPAASLKTLLKTKLTYHKSLNLQIWWDIIESIIYDKVWVVSKCCITVDGRSQSTLCKPQNSKRWFLSLSFCSLLRQFKPPMRMSMHKSIRGKTPNSKIIAVWGQVGQSSFTTCLFGRTCAHLTAADLTLPPDHLDRQSGDGGGVLMMRCRF